MRPFLSRFHLARLTSLTTGSGHTGTGRPRSSSFSSVSSWLIPGQEDVHRHQLQVVFLHHLILTLHHHHHQE